MKVDFAAKNGSFPLSLAQLAGVAEALEDGGGLRK